MDIEINMYRERLKALEYYKSKVLTGLPSGNTKKDVGGYISKYSRI